MSETGHANNVANLKVLIDHLHVLGASYAPTNSNISLPALTALYEQSKDAHNIVIGEAMSVKMPTVEREVLYKDFLKLVTRVINAYASSDAPGEAVANAKSLADRIRGHGLNPRTDKDGKPVENHVSNAHLGYVQRADAFKQLVELLARDKNYAPAEPDLSLAALRVALSDIERSNEVVGGILAPVVDARGRRKALLYDPETGAIALQKKVKSYCKSLASANPEVVKKIQGIRFKAIPD